MIHQSLIDAARTIRSDFERRQAEMAGHIESTVSLKEFLQECLGKIEKVEERVTKQVGTVESNRDEVVATLNEIDDRSRSLMADIQRINKEIEGLREQEISLFRLIKARYPSMSDEQIKVEVQSRI